LGSNSEVNQCPSIYATDRGTYVVQGQRVTDPEALAQLRNVLDGETFVEVPREVFKFAPKVED
jgi:hypothetical protein